MDEPLNWTNNSGLKNTRKDLKTLQIRSHNRDEGKELMIAFVKFLARCAAEEDFRQYLAALENPDDRNKVE